MCRQKRLNLGTRRYVVKSRHFRSVSGELPTVSKQLLVVLWCLRYNATGPCVNLGRYLLI